MATSARYLRPGRRSPRWIAVQRPRTGTRRATLNRIASHIGNALAAVKTVAALVEIRRNRGVCGEAVEVTSPERLELDSTPCSVSGTEPDFPAVIAARKPSIDLVRQLRSHVPAA